MTDPLAKRSLAELDAVLEEIVQRNPQWYKEILQLVEESKLRKQNERTNSKTR